MFGKVIVLGLFEMIKKKKKNSEDRIPGSRFGLRVGSSTVAQAVTFLVVSEPRFRRFYKMIFEIVYDMHCICI